MPEVTKEFVEEVEELVGHQSFAWDCVNAKDIISAVITAHENRILRSGITSRLAFDGWHWQFEFKPEDLWVGAYWKTIGHATDLWICLLPCVPLHISWWYRDSHQ